MEPTAILSDLIKINTVNPPGNETAVARYLKQLFDSAGIPNEIIEPEEGRGSFIARLGSGPKKLLYFAHADVVAAGDDWDFDPFSGEIKDGIIYGRGALDCKDLLAAEVSAALQLAATGKPLNGELIVVAAADEKPAVPWGQSAWWKTIWRNCRPILRSMKGPNCRFAWGTA